MMGVVNFDAQTARFKTQCFICEKIHDIEVDSVRYFRWQSGELIQRVFPEKSEDERELMISGTCPECWKTLAPENEEV